MRDGMSIMKNIIMVVLVIIASLFLLIRNVQYTKETMINPFNGNIVELAKQNDFFRKELATGSHSQVVLMSVNVGEDIGEEIHKVNQTLIFVQGKGETILNGQVAAIGEGSLVFVPAGVKHNFKNTGDQPLKLFTIYAPAQLKPGTVEKEKTEY